MYQLLRSRFAAAVVGLAIAAAVCGCRTPVDQEGPLQVQFFERPGSSLATAPGGQWYVVARRGESPRQFLTVEYDDRTELFVTDAVGERTAEIFPLTRVDIGWFNDALDGTPRLEFHDELDGVTVDDTLGLWPGGERDSMRWLGDAPTTQKRGAVLPLDLDAGESKSLSDHIVGLIDLDEGGVTQRYGAFPQERGPFLVLPDGPVSESLPRAASTDDTLAALVEQMADAGEPVVDAEGLNIVGGDPVTNAAEMQQLAGEHSVELIVAEQDGGFRFGFAADASAPAQGSAPHPVALAQSGFVVDGNVSSDRLETSFHAAADLYRGHPLSTAYRLRRLGIHDNWHVDGNDLATQLRHQDLVAAADYAPWMRTYLVDHQQELGPEIRLYLVRALNYMGRWDSVLRYGEGTVAAFSDWPEQPGSIGRGNTRRLMAEAHRQRGNTEAAAQLLEQAVDDFRLGADPYRAALVQRRRLLLLGETSGYTRVADELEEAGADYEASRTLLLAVAASLEVGAEDRTVRYMQAWTDRFAEAASARLLALYRALHDRVALVQGEATDRDEMASRVEEAISSRWWDAAVIGGLTMRQRRMAVDDRSVLDWLTTFADGMRRTDAVLFESDIEQAVAVGCVDAMFAERDVSAWLHYHCRVRFDRMTARAAGVSSLQDGGYRLLQHGEFSAAEQLEERLLDDVPTTGGWAIPRARTLLFRSARLDESRTPDDPTQRDEEDREVIEAFQDAFGTFADGVDEEDAPPVLRALGERFEARGFERQALALFDAARQAARDANADGEEFEAALALASARYRAGRWADLANMDNVGSPLHAARIDLYRGHAHIVRGDEDRGSSLTERGLEQSREFGELQRLSISHLAAELAVQRQDYDTAYEYLEEGLDTVAALPESVAERTESAVLEARLRTLLAGVYVARGDLEAARAESDRAVELLDDLPSTLAISVRREVLQTAAGLADDGEEFERYRDELVDLYHRIPPDSTSDVAREMSRTVAWLMIEGDEVDGAVAATTPILDEGVGLAATRRHHHCIAGMVRRFQRDVELSDFHLLRCVGHQPEDEMTARAALLMALDDADASVGYRTELVAHLRDKLPGTAPGMRAQLEWMKSFSSPDAEPEGERRETLREQFEAAEAKEPEERTAAAVDYLRFLIDTGDYERADQVLRTEAESFFDAEEDQRPQWKLLRVESLLRQLRPFDAVEYIERGLDDATEDAHIAQLHYFQAVAHHQLGQYFPAQDRLDRAREYAGDAEELLEMIDELESALNASRLAP